MAFSHPDEESIVAPQIFRPPPILPERAASPMRQDKAVPENTRLQIAWDNSMKGLGGVGLPHRKTAVLMISWEEELDDLHTTDEVNALEAVFKTSFRYNVVKKQILQGKRPQVQLQKFLSDFVYEYDGDNTLLIVYYAGHGIPGKPGELKLAGKRRPQEKINMRNSVVWQEAEVTIKRAESDVLVIFDCCFAGNLSIRTRGFTNRNFEFLAACSSGAVTRTPGPNSFTSALIWALEQLVKAKVQFTTTELVSKINNEAPHFPDDQKCHIEERDDEPCLRKLVLRPLPLAGDEENMEYASRSTQQKPIKQYLDLRFFYEKAPDEDEILRLSSSLRDLIATNEISVRHVSWAGLKTVDVIRNVARKWRNYRKDPSWSPVSPSQRYIISSTPSSRIMSPVAPPPSEVDFPDRRSRRNSSSIAVPNMNVGNLNVESMAIDPTMRHLEYPEQVPEEPDYRVKIVIVGLVSALIECLHRLRPDETPALALLLFCAYAWYMTALHANKGQWHKSSRIPSYFTLVIAGISLTIAVRLCWLRG